MKKLFTVLLLAVVCFSKAGPPTVAAADGAAVSVKDFGAVGDGIANDRAAIQKAFSAGKTVKFPDGTYYVGPLSGGGVAIDLRSLGNNISIITEGFVELVCKTTDDSVTQFFILNKNSNFHSDVIRFRDAGFTVPPRSSPQRGAVGFQITNGNDNWGDLHFNGIYGKRIHSGIQIQNIGNNDILRNRIRRIFVGYIDIQDGYYGFNAADQGDDVHIDKIVTQRVYRPYFVYGVSGHEVSVFARANLSTSGAINISRMNAAGTAGLKTSGIKVRYVSRNNVNTLSHVNINHIGPSAGTIEGIELDLDIADAGAAQPAVVFTNYAASGGGPDPAVWANTTTNITIRGKGAGNSILSHANYAASGSLAVAAAGLPIGTGILRNFKQK